MDKSVVYKAITIVACAGMLVMTASFILSFLLPQCDFLDIIFECTSAFATVGLSSGVTGQADTLSKLILALLMYLAGSVLLCPFPGGRGGQPQGDHAGGQDRGGLMPLKLPILL